MTEIGRLVDVDKGLIDRRIFVDADIYKLPLVLPPMGWAHGRYGTSATACVLAF